MNVPITEKALKEWLAPATGSTTVILGASADTRTSPTVRIVCGSCVLPDGFPQESMERQATVVLAAVANADEEGAEETCQTQIDAIQARMTELENEVVTVAGTPGTDILFHAAFLEDQGTENENSVLLYGATYSIFYAYNEAT